MKNLILAVVCLFWASCHKDSIPTKTDVKFKMAWKEALTSDNSICRSEAPVLFLDKVVFHRRYVGPKDVLICRKPQDGALIWKWDDPIDIYDGEKISSFAQKGNNLFVCSQNELYSLDALQGKTIWKTDANLVNQYGYPRISLRNNRLFHQRYSDSEGSFLLSYDITNGQFQSIFEKNLSNNQNYRSSFESYAIYPKSDGDTLLLFQNRQINFQTLQDRIDLYALNLRTLEVEWKRDSIDPHGDSSVKPILVEGDRAYFLGLVNMWCVDARDGHIIWTKTFNKHNQLNFSETLNFAELRLVDGKLLVKPDDERLYSLDPLTGAENWKVEDTGSSPRGAAVYKDLFMFASSGNDGVYVHRISDGKLMARLLSPNKDNSKFSAAQIVTGIAVDEKEGLLFCTDGYFAMCFKIEY